MPQKSYRPEAMHPRRESSDGLETKRALGRRPKRNAHGTLTWVDHGCGALMPGAPQAHGCRGGRAETMSRVSRSRLDGHDVLRLIREAPCRKCAKVTIGTTRPAPTRLAATRLLRRRRQMRLSEDGRSCSVPAAGPAAPWCESSPAAGAQCGPCSAADARPALPAPRRWPPT
jgi:hypothetical protein